MATKNTLLLRQIQPRPRLGYTMPPSARSRGRRRHPKLLAAKGVPPWKARKLL